MDFYTASWLLALEVQENVLYASQNCHPMNRHYFAIWFYTMEWIWKQKTQINMNNDVIFLHNWWSKKFAYAPLTVRCKFIRMKLLVTLSGINSFICSSAIVRASGSPMSFGRLTRRIAANTSPILLRPGDVVIGDTSTIMAFSTRCG